MGSFEGRELFDSNGYKIGDIESVFSEDGRAFALVKSGLFGTIRRLVPLSDVREADDELVVPYSKDKVKLARNPGRAGADRPRRHAGARAGHGVASEPAEHGKQVAQDTAAHAATDAANPSGHEHADQLRESTRETMTNDSS